MVSGREEQQLSKNDRCTHSYWGCVGSPFKILIARCLGYTNSKRGAFLRLKTFYGDYHLFWKKILGLSKMHWMHIKKKPVNNAYKIHTKLEIELTSTRAVAWKFGQLHACKPCVICYNTAGLYFLASYYCIMYMKKIKGSRCIILLHHIIALCIWKKLKANVYINTSWCRR